MLAVQAFMRGRWQELAQWAGQARTLADLVDMPLPLGNALRLLGRAAHEEGDYAAACGLYEQSMAVCRRIGDRESVARTGMALGITQLEQGDLAAAARNFEQGYTYFASSGDAHRQAYGMGWAALCALRAGTGADALVKTEAVLALLQGPLANEPAHETIEYRWLVWKVLQALDAPRAAPLLETLFADVMRRAVELGSEAEREQVVQALPHFRDVAAAYAMRQT